MDYKNKDWLQNQYIDLKKNTYEISEICGCSRHTIGIWIKKHNIRKRSISELNKIRYRGNTDNLTKKICNKCGNLKLIKDFYIIQRSNRKDITIPNKCKDCHNKDCKKYNDKRKLSDQKRRILVLIHYSEGKLECKCCGEKNIEFLQLDHKNGDGAEHRKKLGGCRGSSMYRWVIRNNYPNMFRVLCVNCNFSKGAYGYCPHRNLPEDII